MGGGRTELPRTVAVIGAGFIGTHVAAALLEAGIDTVVITRSPLEQRKRILLDGARLAIIDANARELLRPHLDGVDHVIYCASGLMPAEANLDPTADIHLSLPPFLHTLEALRDTGAGLTFLSSGGTVYGAARTKTIDEQHVTEPVTSYGIMKLAAEKYALMHSRLYGLPLRILRCANVYGDHQPATRSQGVIAVFLERIASGASVPVYGDGSIVRDFVYVGDLVELLLRSIRAAGSTVLNVGSGTGHSLIELVAQIEAVVGRKAAIEWLPDRGYDVPRVVLDIGRLRHELGFEPLSLGDGLERTWNATGAEHP